MYVRVRDILIIHGKKLQGRGIPVPEERYIIRAADAEPQRQAVIVQRLLTICVVNVMSGIAVPGTLIAVQKERTLGTVIIIFFARCAVVLTTVSGAQCIAAVHCRS